MELNEIAKKLINMVEKVIDEKANFYNVGFVYMGYRLNVTIGIDPVSYINRITLYRKGFTLDSYEIKRFQKSFSNRFSGNMKEVEIKYLVDDILLEALFNNI